MNKWIKLMLYAGMTAAMAIAQAPPPAPTFRSGVQLVQLSVVAQDKRGKPVTDLSREDFQVLDNGSPQEVRLFLGETEKSKPRGTEPKAPNTFSNRIASGSAGGGYSVILVDNLNTGFGDPDKGESGTGFAIQKVLQMLKAIRPGENIALYALERQKVHVIQEFTTDRDLLERQLRNTKTGSDTPGTSGTIFEESELGGDTAKRTLQQLGAPAVTSVGIDARQRDSDSQAEMEQLADHLSGIPGRKNLIWIANRFAIGASALRKLNNSGVAIYPITAMGVCDYKAGCPPDPSNQMKAIAALTGGIAYSKRNDVDTAVREAMDDGRASYTLGFYQTGDNSGPRVHQLTVRVSRPDVALRYRTSYETATPSPLADPKTDLAQALLGPIDATQVPIGASVKREQGTLDLQATIDLESLSLTLGHDGLNGNNDRWNGKIEIAARFTAADETLVGKVFSQTLNLHLRQTTYEKAVRGGGLGYHNIFKIPAKAVALKLLFANPASGKIGTLTIPLSEVAAGVSSER